MTQQSNILSFDKARQGASRRRASSRAAVGARDDRYAGLDYYGQRYGAPSLSLPAARGASPARLAGVSRASRVGRSSGAASAAPRLASSMAPSAGAALDSPVRARSGRTAARRSGDSVTEGPSVRVSRGGRAVDAWEDGSDGELTARERRAHLREQAKRSRAKAKAERAFSKQFGADVPDAGEGSSRAAVYKGEMGSKHRQAARMQTGGAQAARSFGFSLSSVVAAALSALKRPRTAVCASVVVCLFLSASFLYPSARTYYQAIREEARLEVEYQALAERNEALESSVAYLQTDAGVEDRARSQYGWVKKGEQAGKVSGIDAAEAEASVSAKVLADEIEPPETWYSAVLDPLFGVS